MYDLWQHLFATTAPPWASVFVQILKNRVVQSCLTLQRVLSRSTYSTQWQENKKREKEKHAAHDTKISTPLCATVQHLKKVVCSNG